MNQPKTEKDWYFERLQRLVGPEGLQKLTRARVMIVGLGGVGSWAAEALARSAVGELILVDFDKVAASNMNRQLNCLIPDIGREKCQVIAQRLRQINPQAQYLPLCQTYNPQTSQAILDLKPQVILDAIDNITYKCHLIDAAKRLAIPIITSTGAAGRFDPGRIKVCDLSHTKVDPVALQVRKKLRKDFAFPSNRSFHITAIYSDEEPLAPIISDDYPSAKAEEELGEAEFAQESSPAPKAGRKAEPYGTISFVTGAFGLRAAAEIVKLLLA